MAEMSATSPKELQAALAAASPGDSVLVTGSFGDVTLTGIRAEGEVSVRAAAPEAAHFERITLRDCANLSFSGLRFWPNAPVNPGARKLYLFTSLPNCAGIEVENCLFRGRVDSDKHSGWTAGDWNAAKIGAVFLRSPNSVIRGNAAIGVYFGYGVAGPSSEIFGNTLSGFAGDALRVTADNCVVIGNRCTDAMQIDENHSDAFQAFKTDSLLNGLVVKDNVLLEWTARPDNPLRAKMQGISFHNGPYANIVVRDNVVATTAWNGLNAHAVENLTITGNRFLNADRGGRGFPWVRLRNCSGEIVVEDNEAEKFELPKGASQRANRAPDYRAKL